jgi:NAD(P)-dependent dehydrogenase (short-subunit alcohol dehydrogenase family)
MSVQRRRNTQLNLLARVAVVTDASRGSGRAIAAVLGGRGATVYVSGRIVRGQPTTDDLPGTIEDTAEEVTRRGGTGIAVRGDRANEHDVEVLFKRIREEQGRLDILVNNAWGGYEGARLMPAYFWKVPLRLWHAMFERGLKAHLLATYFAIPLMIENPPQRRGPGHPNRLVSLSAPLLGIAIDILATSTMLPNIRSCVCSGGWRRNCGSTMSRRSLWLPDLCEPSG